MHSGCIIIDLLTDIICKFNLAFEDSLNKSDNYLYNKHVCETKLPALLREAERLADLLITNLPPNTDTSIKLMHFVLRMLYCHCQY